MSDDNFRAIVAQSPELQARWHTITDTLIAEAKAKFGVDLAKEDLADMTTVRLFTMTGEMIGDPLEQMQQTIPALKQAAKVRELREAITREDHPNHTTAVEELTSKSPAERMRLAREGGATLPGAYGPDDSASELTPAEREAAIQRIAKLRGGAKIAEARRLGLS